MASGSADLDIRLGGQFNVSFDMIQIGPIIILIVIMLCIEHLRLKLFLKLQRPIGLCKATCIGPNRPTFRISCALVMLIRIFLFSYFVYATNIN